MVKIFINLIGLLLIFAYYLVIDKLSLQFSYLKHKGTAKKRLSRLGVDFAAIMLLNVGMLIIKPYQNSFREISQQFDTFAIFLLIILISIFMNIVFTLSSYDNFVKKYYKK